MILVLVEISKPPWWDVTWATWGLVLIGVAGTIAAIWTLRTIAKQTSALVNSERAWLIVEILPVCRMFGNQWHRPVGSGWAPLS